MTTTTVTLAPHAPTGRVGVRVADELIGTVKDGGHIIRNAERILREAGVVRTSGYDLDEERNLVATATLLA